MPLNIEPAMARPDDFYEALIDTHRDLTPEQSRLVKAINYAGPEMPPDKKLGKEQVAVLTEWVKMGAPWPGGQGAPTFTDAGVTLR